MFVAALRHLGLASALGAMALAAGGCGGPGDGTDNTNESTENVPEAFRQPHAWHSVLTRASDAGTPPTVTATSNEAASSEGAGATGTSGSASSGASTTTASAAGSSAAATPSSADGGASGSASAFWYPPTGDFGSCPSMVQQIGFGVCSEDQILKTCTLTSGTICECIRVDGEGQSSEIVCPAPGL